MDGHRCLSSYRKSGEKSICGISMGARQASRQENRSENRRDKEKKKYIKMGNWNDQRRKINTKSTGGRHWSKKCSGDRKDAMT